MSATQYYFAEIHLITASGDFTTYYGHGHRQAGLTVSQLRPIVEAEARAWEPGCKVVGHNLSCNATPPTC
jgi:hypothetical protein